MATAKKKVTKKKVSKRVGAANKRPGDSLIADMSSAELRKLKDEIDARLLVIVEEEKKALIAKLEQAAQSKGYVLGELVGAKGAGRRRARRSGPKAAPKYRNPSDSTQTWTGRGKRPGWFNAALKAGKKAESMLI